MFRFPEPDFELCAGEGVTAIALDALVMRRFSLSKGLVKETELGLANEASEWVGVPIVAFDSCTRLKPVCPVIGGAVCELTCIFGSDRVVIAGLFKSFSMGTSLNLGFEAFPSIEVSVSEDLAFSVPPNARQELKLERFFFCLSVSTLLAVGSGTLPSFLITNPASPFEPGNEYDLCLQLVWPVCNFAIF